MKESEKYIGKKYDCKGVGRVKVLEAVKGGRTKVIVQEIERGAGYCETKQKFVGIKSKKGWARDENKDFGKKHEVHINDLKSYKL